MNLIKQLAGKNILRTVFAQIDDGGVDELFSGFTELILSWAQTIGGFRLQIENVYGEKNLLITKNLVHRIELSEADGSNNIQRLRNNLEGMPDRLENTKNSKAILANKLVIAKEELAQPFRQEQELKDKQARLTQLNSEIDMSGKGEDSGKVKLEAELPMGSFILEL